MGFNDFASLVSSVFTRLMRRKDMGFPHFNTVFELLVKRSDTISFVIQAIF